MDKGPFRAQRSADRPAAVRPEPATPVTTPAPQAPESSHRTHTPAAQSPERKKRWPWIAAAVIVVLIVAAAAYFMMPNQSTGIESGKYQAVSTTDGQVYFGKLTVLSNGYVRLTGAYYLQTQAGTSSTNNSASQTSSTDKNSNSVKLVKLSNKIYGPENEIFIARDQILSYENLAPGGQVAKWLQQNN